jgi:rubredoxin
MKTYVCTVCGYEHNDSSELPDDWACPVCGASKALFDLKPAEGEPVGHSTNLIPSGEPKKKDPSAYLKEWERPSDPTEDWMKDIHEMAQTGHSIHEPMRTKLPVVSWDDILIKGAQLKPMPLPHDAGVSTTTVIGKRKPRWLWPKAAAWSVRACAPAKAASCPRAAGWHISIYSNMSRTNTA